MVDRGGTCLHKYVIILSYVCMSVCVYLAVIRGYILVGIKRWREKKEVKEVKNASLA